MSAQALYLSAETRRLLEVLVLLERGEDRRLLRLGLGHKGRLWHANVDAAVPKRTVVERDRDTGAC